MRFKLPLFPAIFLVRKTLADPRMFVIPTTWEGTNITTSASDRQSIIEGAIEEVFKSEIALPNDYFLSIAATYDFYSSTILFRQQLTDYFTNNPFEPNQNLKLQCIIAMRAYLAYQNSTMLNTATQAWEYGRGLSISEADIAAGSTPAKSFGITKTCSGATLLGGTFSNIYVNDTTIYGESTAALFTLSAYLFQATANSTYLDAAKESGAFMLDVMNIVSANNGIAAMSVNASTSCVDTFGSGTYRLDQAGFFLEGLAMLPSSTTFGLQNQSVGTLRSNLVDITLTENELCNASSGILNAGGGSGDRNLMQGLGVLYHTISDEGPADLVTYIESFLSVQYNTIVSAATTPGSNIYAGSWTGPSVAQYDLTNQTSAVYALVNAVQVPLSNLTNGNHPTGTTSTNPSSTGIPPESTGNNHQTSRTGLIAGGTIGGLLVLAAVGILISYIIRRRHKHSSFYYVDPLYMSEDKTPYPQVSSTSNPITNLSTGITRGTVGFRRKKAQQQVASRSHNESTLHENLPSENLPSSLSPGGPLEHIPTSDLVLLLQARIQHGSAQERGSAPPAYEEGQHN